VSPDAISAASRLAAPGDLAWARALDTVLREPARIGVHFQPIVDLLRGVVAGFEVLARFDCEPRTSPQDWFEAAARLGRAAELEAAVLARALAARADLPPNCFMSLNVGPHALLDDRVHATLAGAGSLGGVVVEITEQRAVEDYDALRRRLTPLREAGAHLAVDDAGAGFASLRHITNLRPDFIKIDRGLVAGIDRDETKAAVVETLGIFASRLDAWVVAEGIERTDELRRLMQLEVPLGQGYGLGRPDPRMKPLSADVVAVRAELGRRRSDGGVGALCETVPAVRRPAARADVARCFAAEAAADIVAVVDRHERPTALHVRADFRRGRPPRPSPLRVLPVARPRDVARRAMTREAAERFDPIAVCDDVGRLVGVVRVERLVEALAR